MTTTGGPPKPGATVGLPGRVLRGSGAARRAGPPADKPTVAPSSGAFSGRVIYGGKASGEALVCDRPLSFFGGFDLERGVVSERGHPLEGRCVAGKVLVFPTGTGSTVGSFALLRMVREGVGPAALVMESCDTTVAVGAIISEVPGADGLDPSAFSDGDRVVVDGPEVRVDRQG